MSFWRKWKTHIVVFFAVLGPGFITANVDNDSGGILPYSQAGAQASCCLSLPATESHRQPFRPLDFIRNNKSVCQKHKQ